MSLSSKEREIALQAIALRATGTPAEAAEQILVGFSALAHPGKPLVVWPASLPFAEQIETLEIELKRVRTAAQAYADDHAKWHSDLQRSLDARSKHPDAKSLPEAACKPAAEAVAQEAHDAAKAEAHPLSVQTPAREASDVSQ